MLVRFLQDYRGKLSDEVFYRAGDEADLSSAKALVDAGRAEFVEAPDEKPPAKSKKKTK